MDDFLFKLQQLIAKNRIEEVIKILLSSFQKCESGNPEAKSEIQGLRNQVVMLSARYTETNDKINNGMIDPVHAGTAKNQLISAFLNTISKLPDYKLFTEYINGLEEEEAWKEAVQKNSIEGYRLFFTTYPHGKYKEETKRIIQEMEAIENRKEAEIKQKAAEEKTRRIQEEEKQKAAEQKKKEEGRQQADYKVKKAKAELEELDNKRKEVLAKKLKAKEELAALDRKKQEALLQKEKLKSASVPLAAAGVAALASDDSSAISTSLFQKKNWLWFVLPVLSALILRRIIEVEPDGFILLLFLIIPPVLYGVAAYKFPLKPKRQALISTSLMALLLICVIISDELLWGDIGAIVFFFAFIPFVFLSLIAVITLHFRNKSLAKKKPN